MSEHELEKLLGGFAADTLTPEEREKLFTTALQDQELFNALADEQALKELLADPAVRRRLLQTLAHQRGTSSWRSLLERLTSPPGLAWAGGVAVGVFAVTLGLKTYQDSLRQASETTALEEMGPTSPSTAPPAAPSVRTPDSDAKVSKVAPTSEPAAKDTVSKTLDSREQVVASRPQAPVAGVELEKKRKLSQQEESKENHAPIAALGKAAEQRAGSSNQRPAMPSAPDSELDVQTLAQAGVGAATGASARALFYGQGHARDTLRAQEKQVESAQKPESFALARKAPQRSLSVKPMAFRYSFVIGRAGEEREVNAALAANHEGTVALTVESNQEGYVQVWTRAGDSLPELVLPAKDTGHISLKTAANQRQQMPVPRESDRLIVRLSRFPFGPITRQEAVMAGRGLAGQLTESASRTEEQATYVANPDLSAAELAIEIPFGTNAPR